MKKSKNLAKIALFVALVHLGTGAPAFSETLDDLTNQVDKFSDNLARSLPFNASLGLNWADAYIGQLLGVPPHFGVGAAMGFTTTDAGSLKNLMKLFGVDLPLNIGGFPMPGYTVEGRIGGFILPFDVGLKFGILPLSISGLELDYFQAGGDVRYAVLKGNVVLPTVSVGMGFNYLSGGLEKKVGDGMTFGYGDNNNILKLSAPTVGFTWKTSVLDFKAQVSKSFLIVTPYVGLGASHAWSKAGYTVDAKLTNGSDNTLTDDEKEAIRNYGIDLKNESFSAINSVTGWSIRAFGGLSFNLAVIRLDLTGLYNFFDTNYGVSLGVRFQL